MSGKAGRSGRKSKAEELGLQELLDTCWPLADREAAIKKLAALSNRGNLTALQILMSYTYGKPTEKQEHSGAVVITVNYADTPAPASGATDDQG